MSEKSILEQALLQVQTLEEAVKHNAKGILASTMKQELNQMLKEEEEEEKEEELAPEEEEKVVASEQDDMSDEEEDSGLEDSEEEDDAEEEDSLASDNDELDSDMDSEESDEMDLPTGDDTELPADDDMELPTGDDTELPADDDMELPTGDDEDVMDMTGASDEEVLKVFKSMKPEDGVVVKKEGNNVELETGDDEFIIKLDEEEMPSEEEYGMEETMEEEMPTEEEYGMEETVYEIELGEEEEEVEKKESTKVEKVEATEAARTKSNPHGNKGGVNRAGLPSKKKYKAGVPASALNEEVTNLRKQNDEYKKALVLFKEKLNEVAVFNANLAYATRLFTEHTTTKSEKLSILKRFDGANTIAESKNLYKTIKTELETKKPVTESVVEKISATPSTSTSATTEVLSESKAYENPQFRRMKDLMTKIK